jgi:hypothetical protein
MELYIRSPVHDKILWQGSATKDGRAVNVALDCKGAIVAQ